MGNKSHKQHQYFAWESAWGWCEEKEEFGHIFCGQNLLPMIKCSLSDDLWQTFWFSHCFIPTSFRCNSAKISRNWLKLGDLMTHDPKRSPQSLIQVIQMWNRYLQPLWERLEAKFTRVWKSLCDPWIKNIKCMSTGCGSGKEYSSL